LLGVERVEWIDAPCCKARTDHASALYITRRRIEKIHRPRSSVHDVAVV
jgi:hypothetical protein